MPKYLMFSWEGYKMVEGRDLDDVIMRQNLQANLEPETGEDNLSYMALQIGDLQVAHVSKSCMFDSTDQEFFFVGPVKSHERLSLLRLQSEVDKIWTGGDSKNERVLTKGER
jgi:hypothetical protein